MRVTMNIFSGRPNPTWKLDRHRADELIQRVTAGAAPLAADERHVLGFRGFTLSADPEDAVWRAGVPARFVVPPPAEIRRTTPKAEAPARRRRPPARATPPEPPDVDRTVSADTAHWLLSTAPGTVADDLLRAADAAINQPPNIALAEQPRVSAPADEPALGDAMCAPFLTMIHPGFWDMPAVRWQNNCYNYATNFASNTMAQPGRRSGRPYTGFTCANVSAAAQSDGHLTSCRGSVRVVALGIWPGFDFHWWRLHPSGLWAHKIGTSPVLAFDNLGRLLANGLTPATCDRGPYTMFCGFLFAPLGVQVL